MQSWKIVHSSTEKLQSTRRLGVKEHRLLTQSDSSHQNIVFLEADQGAEVELHKIENSESLFILDGHFEVFSSETKELLKQGDLVYFPPQTSHGLRCIEGPGHFLAIFAPGGRGDSHPDWLNTTYIEAWKQYSHEDNLSQSRNRLFWGVQAALIALLTAATSVLKGIDPVSVVDQDLNIGLFLLGLVAVVFGTFGLHLASDWSGVTKAARGYIRARRAVMMAIENAVGLRFPFALQDMEERWKRFSRDNPGKSYHPFSTLENLEDLEIPCYEKVSGWESLQSVISLAKLLWFLVVATGLFLVIFSIGPWFLKIIN